MSEKTRDPAAAAAAAATTTALPPATPARSAREKEEKMSHLRLQYAPSFHDPRLARAPPTTRYLPSLRTATIIALPCFSLAGLLLTWSLSARNGLLGQLHAVFAQIPFPCLPGTSEPLVLTYTGIGPIDRFLALLVAFFAPAVSDEHPELGGFGRAGLGGFGAAWTLMVMESMRVGNQGKWISYVTVFGFFIQTITLACTLPIYLFFHLLTSPISHANPSAYAASALFIPPIDLHILPFTITLSYILPSGLMSLPFQKQPTLADGAAASSTLVTARTHQYFIALWQIFPLLSLLVHRVLRKAYVLLAWRLHGDAPATDVPRETDKSPSKTASTAKSAVPSGNDYLRAARPVYISLLAFLILTNASVVLPTLLPARLCTLLLLTPSPASFAATFIPDNPLPIFFPADPHALADQVRQQSDVAASYARHVQTFFQNDIYVAMAAMLVWAAYLHHASRREKALLDPSSLPSYSPSLHAAAWIRADNAFVRSSNPAYRDLLTGSDRGIGGTLRAWYGEGTWVRRALVVGRWVTWAVLGGPMAVVVLLVWERDEIVRRKVKQGN